MIKELKLHIGGEERLLKFGTNGLLYHAGEVFEGDPMELLFGFSTVDLLAVSAAKNGEQPDKTVDVSKLITGIQNPRKLFEYIYAYTYGGLKCAGSEATKEDVFKWVVDMTFEDGEIILSTGRASMIDKNNAQGESKAQTLEESHLPGEN